MKISTTRMFIGHWNFPQSNNYLFFYFAHEHLKYDEIFPLWKY